MQHVVGLPLQIVAGCKGTADARLAIESAEVAGGCWQWQPIKATWKNALDGAGEGDAPKPSKSPGVEFDSLSRKHLTQCQRTQEIADGQTI